MALVDTEGLDLQQRDPEGHRFGTLAYFAFFAAPLKGMNRGGQIVGKPSLGITSCLPVIRPVA